MTQGDLLPYPLAIRPCHVIYGQPHMNITGTPLDINTGINSHKCYYYLDINICHISGIFTVPVSGAWKITFSMRSRVSSGKYNQANIFINGHQLLETSHYTYSSSVEVHSTSGRVQTLEASAGDKIEIRALTVDGSYYKIFFCAEFITKM